MLTKHASFFLTLGTAVAIQRKRFLLQFLPKCANSCFLFDGIIVFQILILFLCFFLFFQLTGDVLMVDRGNCKFTVKANFAEAAGASAVLIINNQKGIY